MLLRISGLLAVFGTLASHDTSSRVPATTPVITVHAKDYSFVAPKTIKSGTSTWRLVNDGKELHHLAIVKLDAGKTAADYTAFMKNPGPPPKWAHDVGGPNPALPGGSVDATLTLEPGNYLVMCFINSPGDPAPHVMKGMISQVTVLSEKTDGVEPVTDVTIHTNDYTFTVSNTLTAGHHVIGVVNDAAQSHEVVFVELPPGKTIQDVSNWVVRDLMKGPPPGNPIGGMAAMEKGRTGIFPIDLKPGRYGLICFIPDARDGKAHSTKGMVKEFTIAAK
jgi:uncharacterized cupredoxin-like copper-binding protein